MPLLDREEYIEQAYLFRTLGERLGQAVSTQELLVSIGQEVLATTRLPMALEFMDQELRLTGGFATAMGRLGHYFTPFQTYVMTEAERHEGRFDFRVALEVLQRDAEYRAAEPTPQGAFLYQFETLCRNRLGYDQGLAAVAGDPIYDDSWREWIKTVRRQVGLVDFADMLYVRSGHYAKTQGPPEKPTLFGEKEGQIALANRRKDPLFLFSALQRHLGYPAVPRPKRDTSPESAVPLLHRKIDRLESRLKLLEEELRGGINLPRFYGQKGDEGMRGATSAWGGWVAGGGESTLGMGVMTHRGVGLSDSAVGIQNSAVGLQNSAVSLQNSAVSLQNSAVGLQNSPVSLWQDRNGALGVPNCLAV